MGAGSSQEDAPQPPAGTPEQSNEPPRKTISETSGNINKEPPSKTISETSGNISNAQTKLPHKYEAILKDADSPVDKSSVDKLYDQLYDGVFLNKKNRKYWIDRKSHNNCFFVFTRDLMVTWADDTRFWRWQNFKETSDEFIDVAEMLNVCWLEVHGKFEASMLTPGISYEVVFVVMLKDPAYGWEVPVNVRLTLPDGSKQERKENMMEMQRGRWVEIPAGNFKVSSDKLGFIEFSLYEYEGGAWKKGLFIKGVAIRPKT